MNKKIVLSVNDIQKSFPGTKALKDVSIELFSGEAHAVVGENGAGKSTLMNIISGVYQADSGSILLNDQEIMLKNPSDAQKAGIGIVHQELALCPHLTVAENVFIGRLPKKNGVIDKKKLQNKTQEILAPFGASIHPGDAVAELSVAKQQIVEIAKVLALECKVIIFDEPTSSLNESEAQRLMQLISTIKKQGIGIFYISHKLSEIFHMCDRITVMRNGNVIETRNVDEINADYIVTKMVGKELDNLYPQKGEHIEKEREIFPKAKEIFDTMALVGCTKCRYCMPCPSGIDIPGIFAIYNGTAVTGEDKAKKEYAELETKADACVKCRKCEKACPQHIKVSSLMEKLAVSLQ